MYLRKNVNLNNIRNNLHLFSFNKFYFSETIARKSNMELIKERDEHFLNLFKNNPDVNINVLGNVIRILSNQRNENNAELYKQLVVELNKRSDKLDMLDFRKLCSLVINNPDIVDQNSQLFQSIKERLDKTKEDRKGTLMDWKSEKSLHPYSVRFWFSYANLRIKWRAFFKKISSLDLK
jgi:hypothetical protein